MINQQPADLRLQIFSTVAEQAGFNTAQLEDGVLSFVKQTNTVYSFDKATHTWLPVGSAPPPPSAFADIASTNIAAIYGNADTTWQGTTDGAFVAQGVHGADWTFDPNSGLLTYSGSTRLFLVGLEMSAGVLGGNADIQVCEPYTAISLNGDMIGSDFNTSPPFFKGSQAHWSPTDSATHFVSSWPSSVTMRRPLPTGTTLQPIVATLVAVAGHVSVSAVTRLWAIPLT